MSAMLLFKGKSAVKCVGAKRHSPQPHRFVWHHILPETCGGATIDKNLVELCDNCHVTIHALLYALATGKSVHQSGSEDQLYYAHLGYKSAVLLGVIDKIPNEGGRV